MLFPDPIVPKKNRSSAIRRNYTLVILSQVVKGFQSKVITNSYLFINLSMVDFMKHLFLPLLCLILLWNLLACSNSNSESGRLEEKGIDPQSKIILEESKEKADWGSKENWESKNAQSKTITDTPDLIANSIVIDGVTRTYFVYIPDAFADVEKLPLIIDFHGGSGTAESQYYSVSYTHLTLPTKRIV